MSGVALVGGALQLVGSGFAAISQGQMVAQQTATSKQLENTREQQMQLEAQRQKRLAVRQALLARSINLVNGTSQGAQYGSGVAAGLGGAINTGAENQQNINAGVVLGQRIFDYNRKYFDITQQGQGNIALGEGISSLGGAIIGNAGAINSLGQDWFNKPQANSYKTPPSAYGTGFGY